jgi:hypothetical protein
MTNEGNTLNLVDDDTSTNSVEVGLRSRESVYIHEIDIKTEDVFYPNE